jgi:enoyl-CoA hydratase
MLRQARLADGTLELVIDFPPVNAFSIGLLREIAGVLEAVGDDPSVHVVLVRAEGRGFCAGGDVKEMERLSGYEGILGQAEGAMRLVLAVLNCAVPVVSAIHVYCVGVGVLLAGGCDVVVASERTRFVLAEIDNGATMGGVLALRLMPPKRAVAAMMTADPILAEDLLGYGSVYRVVPETDLVEAARGVASRIAAKAPEAMRRLKRSLYNTTRAGDVEAACRAELSYTYELNITGQASAGRRTFITGTRGSYLGGPDTN